MNPALARSLEALWGFTSNSPGVRHSSPAPPSITSQEAADVLGAAMAAIPLLLALDTASS